MRSKWVKCWPLFSRWKVRVFCIKCARVVPFHIIDLFIIFIYFLTSAQANSIQDFWVPVKPAPPPAHLLSDFWPPPSPPLPPCGGGENPGPCDWLPVPLSQCAGRSKPKLVSRKISFNNEKFSTLEMLSKLGSKYFNNPPLPTSITTR